MISEVRGPCPAMVSPRFACMSHACYEGGKASSSAQSWLGTDSEWPSLARTPWSICIVVIFTNNLDWASPKVVGSETGPAQPSWGISSVLWTCSHLSFSQSGPLGTRTSRWQLEISIMGLFTCGIFQRCTQDFRLWVGRKLFVST